MASATGVKVTITGLKQVLAKYGQSKTDAAKRAGLQAVTAHFATKVKLKLAPHTRTGFLRTSITGEVKSAREGDVAAKRGAGVYYAKFVEHGTGVHGPKHSRIYPKVAKAMAWHPTTATGKPTGAKRIVRKSVAGQKPVKMFEQTVQQETSKAADVFKTAFMKALH